LRETGYHALPVHGGDRVGADEYVKGCVHGAAVYGTVPPG
jgi:hypothetical protein